MNTASTSNERVYYLETEAHSNSILQNMRDLQQRRMFCDVTVNVGQEEYFCHRVILVAASPYFRNVLDGEDRLETNSVVKINLPPQSFQLVLEYIYTGKLPITSKNVVDLILASKYLKMDTLETACQEAMSVLLSPSSLSLDTTKGQSQPLSSGAIPREHAKREYSSYIFATGGRNHLDHEMSECEIYNPGTNSWYPIASMNNKRYEHAVIGCNRFLYAFGGLDNEETLSSVEYYNPVKDTWTWTSSLPHERFSHGICSLNGSIFICGGRDKNSAILSSVEAFDPLTSTYISCPAMNTERSAFKVAATGGCIYAIGGLKNLNWLDSVERLDPREGRWSPAPSMKTGRWAHGVTVLDDYIYCTGGMGSGTGRSGERLNIRRDEWEPIPDMHTDRESHDLITMDGGVYAIGGHLFEKFDPGSNRWFQLQSTPKERYYLGASVLDCCEIKCLK